MFSYFWGSELHLAALGLGFESIAAIVELFIAAWVWSLRHKHQTPELEKRREKLETAFSLGAAIFFIVAVGVSWRIVVLQSASEEQQIQQTKQLKDLAAKYNEATNDLVLANRASRQAIDAASNLNAEALRNLPRHLSRDQRAELVRLISKFTKGKFNFVLQSGASDAEGLSGEFTNVFSDAGWEIIPGNRGFVAVPDGINVYGDEAHREIVNAIAAKLTSFGLAGVAHIDRGTAPDFIAIIPGGKSLK